jgi:hypothetical protein
MATQPLDEFSDRSFVDFENESVISTGIVQPIALEFLPDGRMLVLEKQGVISIADPETGQFQEYLDISSIVNDGRERGLLEIAVPLDFDPTGDTGDNHIYLFYTRSADTNRGVIGRFEHQENAGGLTSRLDSASEEILWTDTDGFTSCCHYGGGLDFGPDGKLWLTTSDKFNTTNASEGPGGGDDVPVDLQSTSGKIIRINPDGSIPDGTDGTPANPYVDGIVDGPYPDIETTFPEGWEPDPSIWAYGLRNAFRGDWDPVNELLYIGEVGGNQSLSRDDIHVASLDQAGAFYGWNFYEGVNNVVAVSDADAVYDSDDFPQPDQDLADPATGDYFSAAIFDIPHSSMTGGFVYRGDQFPTEFNGVYFYGNYENNYIRFLDLDETGTVVEGDYLFKPSDEIPGSTSNVVFLAEGTDGALYYINYSGSGGQVQRIVFNGDRAPEITNAAVQDTQGDPNDGFGPAAPLAVTFTAIVTDADTDLTELTYSIDFGDGSAPVVNQTVNPTTGLISVAHEYTAVGNYSAQLSVSDGVQTVLATPFDIVVGDPNDPPEILSAEPDVAFGDAGLTVTFTATVTDPDAGDPPESLSYIWDFGDGSSVAAGNPNAAGEITVQHTYASDGLFNASLTISDGEAPDVSSQSIPIRIGDVSGLPVEDGLAFQVESFIKVGTDGTNVTEWLDESGNGNNLVAVGDPQILLDATPTGLPAIELDGIGDYLQRVDATDEVTNFSLGSQARTMFFVVDYDTVTNNEFAGLVYGNDSQNQAFGLTLDGNENDFALQGWGGTNDRNTDIDGVIDPATGEERGFVSHAVVYDGSDYTHYVNGEVIDSGSKSYNTVMERLVIGQNLNGGETPMKVAAALVYNRALNPDEFNAVETYLQTTYLGATANAQPNAVDDSYDVDVNGSLIVPASTGLLNNDIDDGPLTVTEINGTPVTDGETVTLANGTLQVSSDGGFTYTPNAAFTGQETFSYTASDGELSETANVSVDVDEPGTPSAPPAEANLVGIWETDFGVVTDGSTVTDWLSGAGTNLDLTASGDPQIVANATPGGASAIVLDGTDDWLDRNLSLDTGGSDLPTGAAPRSIYFVVDYTSVENFAGVSFGDASTNEAFGLVVAGASSNLSVQGFASGDLNSDSDGVGNNDGSTGDDWFIQSARYDGSTVRHYKDDALIDSGTRVYETGESRIVIGDEIGGRGNGEAMQVAAVLIYDKELDDAEHAEAIAYLREKYLESIDPTNVPPTADDDVGSTDEDTAVAIDVLDGDADSDGTVAGVVEIEGVAAVVDSPVALSSGATATLLSDGTISYNPNGAFESLNNGESDSDSFTYTIADDDGAEASATVSVDIAGVTDDTGGGPGTNPVTASLVAAFEVEGITSAGSAVTGWTDTSGSTNDYSLAGVLGDPEVAPGATPSGQDAVAFDGAGDILRDVGTAEVAGLPAGDAPRTLFFVVDYKTEGEFTGFAYGNDATGEAFGLVTEGDESLSIEGWSSGTRDSGIEGVETKGWMVHSVVLDGANYKHYIHTADGGLQLIDSGSDGAFNTNITDPTSALAIAGKPASSGNQSGIAGEMDVAAALIYESALSTGGDDLGGEHASVSQYLFDKYIASGPANVPPTADDDVGSTDEDTAVAIDVLDGDADSDGTVAGVVEIEGVAAVVDSPVALSSGATATLLSDGTISYNPNGAFESLNNGESDSDSFTYTIADDDGAEASATVSVDIAGVTDDTGGGPGTNPVTASLVAAFEVEGITSAGSAVTGWTDTSGSTNDYSLAGVLGDPEVAPGATPSGQDAVAFDGAGDILRDVGTAEVAGLPAGDAPRTLFFVVDYKTEGEFTGFAYGNDATGEAFGLVTEGDESLSIEGWSSGTRDSGIEGVETKGWMVHSVVLDGANYKHYIHTADGGLQLIDSGSDGAFNTNITDPTSALAIAGKPASSGNQSGIAGEMDVAAALIYESALSTGGDDLGGEHASVSQYLFDKYIASGPANVPPTADDDVGSTDEDTAVAIDVLDGDADSDGTVAGVVEIEGVAAVVDSPVALSSGATATLLSDGTISYNPNGAFESLNNGESDSDSFTYTIADDDGAEASATVSVDIAGVTDDTGGGPGTNPVTASLVAAFEVEGITSAGSAVTGWTDTSGSTNDYSLAGVLGDPEVAPGATPSGQDAVAFDGAGDILRDVGTAEVAGLPAGDAPRTLFFVVDYKTEGEFTGFAYGNDATGEAFGLVTEGDESLSIEGWSSGTRDSGIEGVETKGWMVHSVVLDGANYKHYIHTADGGLQLIDSGSDGAFNTNITDPTSALAIAGKPASSGNQSGIAGEMDVAAALIYESALSTGGDDLGGEHASVSQYLFDKYIASGPANVPPTADDDVGSTDEDTAVAIDVLDGDADSDGTVAGVVEIEGVAAVVDSPVALSSGATATLLSDGTISYNPNGAFESLNNGESDSDSFTYTIADDDGAEASATVSVDIAGVTDDTGGGPGAGIGLWQFTDAAPGLDETVQDNTALLQNGAFASGGAVQLDGTNAYIEIPDLPIYDIEDGGFRVTLTVDELNGQDTGTNPLTSGQQGIVSRDSSGYDGGGHVSSWVGGDGAVYVRHQTTGQSFALETAAGVVTAGEAITLVYRVSDAEGMQLFEDDGTGELTLLAQNAGADVSFSGNDEPWVLGALQVVSGDGTANNLRGYLDGEVDHFELFSGEADPGDPNVPPTAVPDVALTQEDTPLSNIDVLSNDTDGDGDLPLELASVVQPVNGSVTANADGTLNYAPNANFFGTDVVTYLVRDARGAVSQGTLSVTVDAVEDPAVANDDDSATLVDIPVAITVLANDIDVDGPPPALLDFDAVSANGGTVTEDGGVLTYAPAAAFEGIDTFDYQIVGGDTATVTVQVTSEPLVVPGIGLWQFTDAAPGLDETVQDNTALLQNGAFASGGAVQLDGTNAYIEIPDLPIYDIEDGGFRVTLTVDELNGQDTGTNPLTSGQQGIVSRDSSGYDGGGHVSSWVGGDGAVYVRHQTTGQSFALETAAGVVTAGEAITLVYRVSDAEGMQLFEDDGTGELTLLAQNAGADVSFSGNDEPWVLGALQVVSGDGTANNLRGYLDGEVDHFELFSGEADPGDPNVPPTAVPDVALTQEDTPLSNIDVLSNDTDGDGDLPLELASVVQPVNGSVTANADGTLNYAPNANFFGTDVVTYLVRDARGAVSQGTLSVTVDAVEDPAVANDDDSATLVDIPVAITVLANDIDVDGPPPALLDFDAVSANGGTVTEDGGVLTYAPAAAFEGIDTFDYQIVGGDTATVTVQVTSEPLVVPGIGLWQFTDAAPGLDETVQDNTALLQNGAFASGGAVQLDGTNAYIEIPDLPIYDIEDGGFRVTLTVDELNGQDTGTNPLTSGQQGIVSRDSSGYDGGGHVSSWVGGDGAVYVRHQTTGQSFALETAAGVVTAGEAITLVYRVSDAEGMQLFEDDGTGELTLLAQNAGADVSFSGNDEPWVLGALQVVSGDGTANNLRGYLDGEVDHFELFSGEADFLI